MGTRVLSFAQTIRKKSTQHRQQEVDVTGEGKTSPSIPLCDRSRRKQIGEFVMSTTKKKPAKGAPASTSKQPATAPVITGTEKVAAEVSYQTLVNGLST